MPGWLESIEINEENVTGNEDFLKGNIFQKITASIVVRFQTWFEIESTTEYDKRLYFKPSYMDAANPTANQWIDDYDRSGAFDNFNVGDTIHVIDTNANANDDTMEIIEKPNRYNILVGNFGTLSGLTKQLETTGRIDLEQIPTGIIFDHGLIGNNEGVNFNSKVSGDLMRWFYGDSTGFSYSGLAIMAAQGRKDWMLGISSLESATTTYIGSAEDEGKYIYPFQMDLVFLIDPFYLYTQLLDLITIPRKPPKYFLHQECLRYVFRMRALRDYQDYSIYQEYEHAEPDGRTGWVDELYNGGNNEYEVDDSTLVFSNGVGLTRNDTVTVTFDIKNTLENIGGDPEHVCVNFIMLPEAELQYRLKDEYKADNFGFDRANQTEGAAAINGVRFGTNWEVIKSLTVISISGGVTVSFNVDFGSDVQSIIDGLNDKRYMIAAYAVGNGLASADANYNTMFVDIGQIQVDIPASTIDVTSNLLFHDQNAAENFVYKPTFKIEDEVVAYSEILLDRSNLDVQIDSFKGQIVMQKSGEADVILSEKEWDLSGLSEVGPVRWINTSEDTPFIVSTGEIREKYKCYRKLSLDTGDSYGYAVQHPFVIRWEDWEQLILPLLPSDFQDSNENFNGFNQNWMRLIGLSGWTFHYRVATTCVVDSTVNTLGNDVDLIFEDYEANTDWINETITCLDGSTNLTSGGQPFILSKMTRTNTTVRAEFTWNGAKTIPSLAQLWGTIGIYIKEVGTYITKEALSSVYNRDSVVMFTSSTGKVVLSNPSASVVRLECEIDYNDIPDGITEFTIVSRIGEGSETLLWTPFNLGGALWLDGAVGVTEASGRVSEWADQSGNGNDSVQLTGTNQPELSSINSIQSIDFGTGKNYALDGNDLGTWTDIVLFGVFQADALNAGVHVIATIRDSATNMISIGTSGTSLSVTHYDGTTTTSKSSTTTISTGTTYYFVVQWESGVLTLRVNAVDQTGALLSSILNSVDQYWLGSTDAVPTTENFEGSVGELGVKLSALAVGELTLLEDYLDRRWIP